MLLQALGDACWMVTTGSCEHAMGLRYDWTQNVTAAAVTAQLDVSLSEGPNAQLHNRLEPACTAGQRW